MKCGLLGGSAQQLSLPFDAQRSVNCFPILDPNGKDVGAMYGSGGLLLLNAPGSGPGRGGYTSANGRVFVISGSQLIEIQGDGSGTVRGSLDQSQGVITIDENPFQLAICDGKSLYIFTYLTNIFVKVSSPNLLLALTVVFLDGYFIVNSGGGKFQISSLYDGTTWAALDFATAESSPDDLLRVLNIAGLLWLQGLNTTEVWSNTGGTQFPFAKISGAKMETGTGAPYASLALDNSCFWIGQDRNSFGIVYRAEGFSPKRISTEPIERRIREAPDRASLRSYARQDAEHVILTITGGGMETTLNYDLATQQWFETAYLNPEGAFELHLGAFGFFAFGKQIVLDRKNGNIYEQSQKYYDDAGNPLVFERTFTHIIDENKRFVYKNLTVGFETGVGTQTGQGYDPQAILYQSRDGAQTFNGGRTKSMGKAGQFLKRVTWWQLGQARIMTFKVRITDPVPRRISGAWFNT